MNVLFTTPTYYPHNGGAESCIADLATAYVKQGHRVTVITSRTHESLPKSEIRDGVSVVRIEYPPTRITCPKDALLVITRSCAGVVQIARLIRKREIDTVCLGLVGIDSLLIAFLHRLLGFKLIVYIHGGEIRSYIKVSPLIRWTLKRCLRDCYAVIAVSEELKRETVAFAPNVERKLFVLPNPIPLAKLAQVKPYQHHRRYLLFVGRLHQVKGVEILLKAFQGVAEQLPDLDLIIVGSGPLDTSLRKLAGEYPAAAQIVFLGDQERSTVFALMKGCEFLVLPSFAEGCPISLLEALAVGKMTIGSRVKGIINIIQHDVNGVLFDAGRVETLSSLLATYATNLPARLKLEANIRNNDLQEYDLEGVANRHLYVYSGARDSLRICLISPFYYHDDNCAGLSSYYFNLAKSLIGQDAAISLITSENAKSTEPTTRFRVFEVKQNGNGRRPPRNSTIQGLRRVTARFRFSIEAYKKVRELDRSSGLDIIIAPELFAPALLVGLFMRKKLFTRIHTPTYVGDSYNDRSQLIGRTLSMIERAQAKRSQGLSVASESLAALVARDWRLPRHRIEVIPNSVQVEWVRNLASTQPMEISGEYLLYFGRLEKRKGVHIIARALPEILAGDLKIKMVFVGRDAGLKNEILRLNARYHDRIVFIDTLEKAKLFGLVRDSKLVLLPSLFENMSNAGLEAMALGRPIIGTFKTSFAEIIEDNVDGFLVEPGDPQALSAKVLSCLAMTNLEQVGENAYRKVMRFDSRNIVSQNIDFYRRIMGLPGRARQPLQRISKPAALAIELDN